jgi:hypothetical protein
MTTAQSLSTYSKLITSDATELDKFIVITGIRAALGAVSTVEFWPREPVRNIPTGATLRVVDVASDCRVELDGLTFSVDVRDLLLVQD